MESAVEQPFPGWIDAVCVADPLLVAYGRGRVREFPGATDSGLDVVLVDHVIGGLLAAAAEFVASAQFVGCAAGGCTVYQVKLSRNLLSLRRLMESFC